MHIYLDSLHKLFPIDKEEGFSWDIRNAMIQKSFSLEKNCQKIMENLSD
ncbi:hypothetical protein LPAF129_07040 [Ligilactobacillus pabuli]|uniref:Uncharacterized protein n=1 Tax=Ligilactobacillus pabuli TaxID=2886039 RepID=A0ABQ5JGC4_9LACO|nr:hypothetical protein LPAF129_07040 [Ligilactobacillus pabuli]